MHDEPASNAANYVNIESYANKPRKPHTINSATLERARLIKAISEQSKDAVLIVAVETDNILRGIWINPAFTNMSGIAAHDIVGRRIVMSDCALSSECIGNILAPKTNDTIEYRESMSVNNKQTGVNTMLDVSIRRIQNVTVSDIRYAVVTYRTQDKNIVFNPETSNERRTNDPLTQLANRSTFIESLDKTLSTPRHAKETATAVLYLDLDRFKLVNDTFGRYIGDKLLVAIARRLQTIVSSQHILARFGGDEFCVLIDNASTTEAVDLADAIVVAFSEPFCIEQHEVFATVSIGITIDDYIYDNAEDVMRDADIAMYHAKATGRNRFQIFDAAQRSASIRTLTLQNDLRQATSRNEMEVYYQPIFSMTLQKLIGFEALLRWNHHGLGAIAPTEFIPVAEETGTIIELGTWALKTACKEIRLQQTLHPHHANLEVSVNVSAAQIVAPNFEEIVLEALNESGLAASCLHLEITESVLISDPDRVTSILQRLRKHGISIYIDDFGTGYSSLSYLHRFAVDALKIDRSFVSRDNEHHLANPRIVETIILLASHLEIDVIAEGVETSLQAAQLLHLNCSSTQGYWHAKAMNRAAMSEYLAVTTVYHDDLRSEMKMEQFSSSKT